MYDEGRTRIDRNGVDVPLRRIVEHVEEYGTHVVQVDDDDYGGFSYTIGLQYHHDHPEMIVFGQKPGWRQWLLNAMRDEILGGARFSPGPRYAGILENLRIAVKPVPDAALPQYLDVALWFYREIVPSAEAVRAVQVVWPDANDLLPWEWGYRGGFRQPILDGTARTPGANGEVAT